MHVRTKYGPWALVAGASEGLGAAWADALAARGLNVILLARRQVALTELAAVLKARHAGVDVETAAIDLGSPTLVDDVTSVLNGRDIGLYVHNAAFVPQGAFLSRPLREQQLSLDVNCRAPLALAHTLGTAMAHRGRGGIVLMSSLTAFQGTPLLATYGATKAFNLTLAEGLHAELAPRGVDVLACCAGATRTPGYLRSGAAGSPGELEPRQVVEEALGQLGRRAFMVPGGFNRFASLLMRRLLPRASTVKMLGKQAARLTLPASTALLLVASLTFGSEWKALERTDDVLVEARDVVGSKFVELRLTTKTKASVERLCEVAFGEGKKDPEETDLQSRTIISESANERVTYDQISPPVVANRDYGVKATREPFGTGGCIMRFQVANEFAPKQVPDGWVRIMKLRGHWAFVPSADGTTHVEYVIHTDPAGSVPPLFVEGARRKTALAWVARTLARAQQAKP